MSASFTLLFGVKALSSDATAQLLASALNVDFTERSSLYLGDYLQYEGPLADKLSVRENFVPGFGLSESDFRQYPVLIYAYFYSGTESDRIDKFLHLRDRLMQLSGLELLRDFIPESEDEETELS